MIQLFLNINGRINMLGLGDFWIFLIFILIILSVVLCVVYGVMYWNRDSEPMGMRDEEARANEKKE